MKNRILTTFLTITLLVCALAGCSELPQKTKSITADTTYYSVTNAYTERNKNVYMTLDISIPKITYSNDENSALIDSVNKEISDSLNELLDETKKKAQETFNTYLKTAKENFIKDRKTKIEDLKKKYADVLGEKELQILKELSESKTEDEPIKRPKPPKATVSGFTTTDELIIPNLHNKNIIVVETTEANITETSIKIDGRPGQNKSINQDEIIKQDEIVTSENEVKPTIQIPATESEIKSLEQVKASQSEIETIVQEEATESNSIVLASKSNIELTLNDFYNELKNIEQKRIPNNYYLASLYTPTTITCHYEVKCLDEDYLSLFVELTESRTTEIVKRLFYNIDLNDKKIVKIKDILGDKYKETIVTNLNSAIDNWSDEQKSQLIENYSVENYISEDTPFFINNNHKPVIEIEKFAITVGSSGYHEFQIP